MNYKICINCGNECDEHSSYCPKCGCPLNQSENKMVKKKKKGHCGTIVWFVFVLTVVVALFGGDKKKDKKDDKKSVEEKVEQKEEKNISFKEELDVFSNGNYLFITNQDLDKYCSNMDGVNVYVVTDIDDIKDGKIQSTLADGFMMSGFNVGDRYSKYESNLEEGDIVAICGTVSGRNDYGSMGNSVNLEDSYVFAVGEEANNYKKEASDSGLSEYFSVTEEVADSNEVSEGDYKSLCQNLGYEDVLRNPDSYDGKYCVLSGTVDQIIDGILGTYTIYIVDEFGNKWECGYIYKDGEAHLLSGDQVTLYGKCGGTSNSTTVLGEQVTMPYIDVEYLN